MDRRIALNQLYHSSFIQASPIWFESGSAGENG